MKYLIRVTIGVAILINLLTLITVIYVCTYHLHANPIEYPTFLHPFSGIVVTLAFALFGVGFICLYQRRVRMGLYFTMSMLAYFVLPLLIIFFIRLII